MTRASTTRLVFAGSFRVVDDEGVHGSFFCFEFQAQLVPQSLENGGAGGFNGGCSLRSVSLRDCKRLLAHKC